MSPKDHDPKAPVRMQDSETEDHWVFVLRKSKLVANFAADKRVFPTVTPELRAKVSSYLNIQLWLAEQEIARGVFTYERPQSKPAPAKDSVHGDAGNPAGD